MMGTYATRRMEDAVFFALRHPIVSRASQTGFGWLAGIAANLRPLPADAACCTGPYGSGQCSSLYCSGSTCTGTSQHRCNNVVGYCPTETPCWTGAPCANYGGYQDNGCTGTCCDCVCTASWGTSYCYCYA